MRIKNAFWKLLVSLLIVLTLVNFIGSINVDFNYSFADDSGGGASFAEGEEKTNSLVGGIISGIVNGIFNALIKMPLVLFCRAVRSITSILAGSQGTMDGTGALEVSPFDIFFNRCNLLDANIFSTRDVNGKPLDPNSLVYNIRTNTAVWYYSIRGLAIGVIGVMLLWNLIRSISKSTSAEQKSTAKSSLTDWVLSFALVMFMHIIVIVVLNMNDLFLTAIQKTMTDIGSSKDFYDSLENAIFSSNLVLGLAGIAVYGILNFQTLKFTFIYIHRLLTLVVLIMISPIVPITYSTDKMRGGRGVALNGWLRELFYNMFIQSIHALIYAALVSVSMNALISGTHSIVAMEDLSAAVVAIASILFIKHAERMIKTIFGFDNSTILNNNVFKDAAETTKNFFGGIARAGARVATGGPMISFGKNVDGSHIGIGQVAQGIKTNFGNTVHAVGSVASDVGHTIGEGISNVPHALGAAGGTAVRGVKSIPGGVVKAGKSIKDGFFDALHGENADQEVSAQAEASAYAEATAENGVDGKDGNQVEVVGVVVEDRNSSQSEQKDKELYAKIDAAVAESNENIKNEKSQKLEDEKRKLNNKEEYTEVKSEKTTIKTEKIEEVDMIPNSEKIAGNYEENNLGFDKDEKIPVAIGETIKPELLDKFKEMFNAIRNDDEETLNEWADEVQGKIDYFNDKIDSETRDEIFDKVHELWNDPQKLQEYIGSLQQTYDTINNVDPNFLESVDVGGSVEDFKNNLDYAKAVAEFHAFVEVDDESNQSKEKRLEALIESFNKQGVRIPAELAQARNQNKVDSLQAVPGNLQSEGVSRRIQAVTEAGNVTTNRVQKNQEAQVDLSTINNSDLKSTLSGLGRIGYRVRGNLEGLAEEDIEAEIAAEYMRLHSNLSKKIINKTGNEPKGLKEIYRNMDEDARRQFNKYATGQLNAKKLKGDARDFAALSILERRANQMGYSMSVGDQITETKAGDTEYTYSVKGIGNGVQDQVTRDTRQIVRDMEQTKILSLEEARKRREAANNKKLA